MRIRKLDRLSIYRAPLEVVNSNRSAKYVKNKEQTGKRIDKTAAKLAERRVHPFQKIGEYQLLKRIFNPRERGRSVLPYLHQIKRLIELEERRPSLKDESISNLRFYSNDSLVLKNSLNKRVIQNSRFSQQAQETLSPDTIIQLKKLGRSSELTGQDIQTWVDLNLSSSNAQSIGSLFDQAVEVIIESVTSRTLFATIHFLSDYWKRTLHGPTGSKVQRQAAEEHVVLLFQRALSLYPETEYHVEHNVIVSQPGVNDLSPLRELYEAYLKIFGLPHTIARLDDLWFQIVSKCDTIENADNALVDFCNQKGRLPSDKGIDIFIKSLGKHIAAQEQVFDGPRHQFVEVVKTHLLVYRKLLVSDQVTPAVVEFLLMWTSTMNEFYSVMDTATNSKQADKIMSLCQPAMLKTVVKCALNVVDRTAASQEEQMLKADNKKKSKRRNGRQSKTLDDDTSIDKNQLKSSSFSLSSNAASNSSTAIVSPRVNVPIHARAMAHMFGVLNRFNNCSAGITSEALNECLILSAKYGNSAGMYRALAMKLKQGEMPASDTKSEKNSLHSSVPPDVLCQVFDSFPISSGGMHQEKKSSKSLWVVRDAILSDDARDQAILYHLRTMLNTYNSEAFKKYIGALGRCNRSELLDLEWHKFIENSPNWIKSQGVVLEFISAYATTNDVTRGLQIVTNVLDISRIDQGEFYQASVSVIQTVLRYDVLPLGLMLRHTISWFLQNKKSAKWSEEDIAKVFHEIGQSRTFSQHEKEVVSLIGQELVRIILQCRNGLDIEESITSFDELLAGTL